MQYRDLTLYLFSVQRYKYVHLEDMKTFISLQSGMCLVVPCVYASITFIQYFFTLLVFTKSHSTSREDRLFQNFTFLPSQNMRSEKARNIFAVLGAIYVYMSFGIKFTTGNLNPYLKPFLNITNGETVWFHATIKKVKTALHVCLHILTSNNVRFWSLADS